MFRQVSLRCFTLSFAVAASASHASAQPLAGARSVPLSCTQSRAGKQAVAQGKLSLRAITLNGIGAVADAWQTGGDRDYHGAARSLSATHFFVAPSFFTVG